METTILIVEDDQAILELLSSTLASAGYRVLSARDSNQALDLSAGWQGDIHLLIADVRMDPSMTGFELAQCLRLMRVEIKVLYISGFGADEMVRWEVEGRLADFLPKPFLPADLLARVRTVLAAPVN